jgi:hypothetical protein
LSPSIKELLTAYNSADPEPDREEAITIAQLRFLHQQPEDKKSSFLLAQANLIIGAFFFAVRSCEYSAVKEPGHTKLLESSDIVFTDLNNKTIEHNNPKLFLLASYVSITFRDQKNRQKNITRSHQRTVDPIICLVKAWSKVIQRIRTTKRDDITTVNYFFESSSNITPKIHFFSQQDTIDTLRNSSNKGKSFQIPILTT